jgi:NADH-quinone oxidoreductase subunit I
MAPWLRKLWLPAIAAGMAVTLKHLLRSLFGRGVVTISYPEERHIPPPGFRGEHYLKVDDQGRIQCVACFLCATACPANCIHIEAAPAPWNEREKYPAVFDIDMLVCIFCGMCEEACPCDAIALSPKYYTCTTSREDAIYHRDRLVANYPGEAGPTPLSRAPGRMGDHI